MLTFDRRRQEGVVAPDTVIFFDITDDKFNQRWGARLPQLKASMIEEASKHFDVHSFVYNSSTLPADKAAVKEQFCQAIQARCKKLDVPPELGRVGSSGLGRVG